MLNPENSLAFRDFFCIFALGNEIVLSAIFKKLKNDVG